MSTYTITDQFSDKVIELDSMQMDEDEIRAAIMALYPGAPAEVVEVVEQLIEAIWHGTGIPEGTAEYLGLSITN